MTPESIVALQVLRSPDHFEWYFVNILAMVIALYANAVRKRDWHQLALAVGFTAGELVWEMINALVLHFSKFSALWTVSGKSVFLIFVGLNIEIYLMFAMAPLVLFALLPEDRSLKILGISNRILIQFLFGLFCVGVECILNAWGALAWAWPWWSWPNVGWIVVAYCAPFMLITWLHDLWSLRAKCIAMVISIITAALGWGIFVEGLHWI